VRPSLLTQPYRHSESAATFVTQALADPKTNKLLAATAWLRASGLGPLAPSIEALKDRGGHADLFVGLDYRGTTVQGLNAAVPLFDRIFVVHDVEGRTFHPKLYLVRGRSEAYLLIGSNNLTAGGVGFNYEAAIVHKLNLRRADHRELVAEVELFATRLMSDSAICKRLTPSLLNRLDRDGWLGDESKRTPASNEDAGPTRARRTTRSGIFTRSKVLKRTRPIPPATTSQARRRVPSRRAPLTPDTWWKQLNNTDVQRPSAGNPVGSVRITRPPGLALDPATFFRQQLFANERWRKRQDHSGNQIEIAELTFDCYLERRQLGTKRLRVDYGPHRARRSRATTLLHWDELADLIHHRNFKDWFLLIERGAGRTHRLTLTRTPPA
jgi:hypothetical protein